MKLYKVKTSQVLVAFDEDDAKDRFVRLMENIDLDDLIVEELPKDHPIYNPIYKLYKEE